MVTIKLSHLWFPVPKDQLPAYSWGQVEQPLMWICSKSSTFPLLLWFNPITVPLPSSRRVIKWMKYVNRRLSVRPGFELQSISGSFLLLIFLFL